MVSVEEKNELINRARRLGEEYMFDYRGCAQTTLLAVADTLDMEITDDVFKTVAPLSSFTGGCGGMCGAAAAFGLRYCKTRDAFLEETGLGDIKDLLFEIQTRFEDKYTGYLCRDITRHLYGRSFDFRKPEDVEAFSSMYDTIYDTCSKVTADAAGWTVESILNREHTELTP
jgi:hypothetical protein